MAADPELPKHILPRRVSAEPSEPARSERRQVLQLRGRLCAHDRRGPQIGNRLRSARQGRHSLHDQHQVHAEECEELFRRELRQYSRRLHKHLH